MSFISAGNTTTTTLLINGDTTGNLVFNTGGANTTALTLSNAQVANFTNPILVGGNQAINGPSFSAYLPTARQNVTASTWTKVALSAEEFDTNSNFDSTTNYRFTPTVAGYYQIQGTITFDASVNAAAAQASIYKNGTSYKNSSLFTSAGAISSVMLTVSSVIYLNGSTDYVELWGNYDASSNPRFSFGSSLTYFSGSLVRGA